MFVAFDPSMEIVQQKVDGCRIIVGQSRKRKKFAWVYNRDSTSYNKNHFLAFNLQEVVSL
jgi:hypothetical protein